MLDFEKFSRDLEEAGRQLPPIHISKIGRKVRVLRGRKIGERIVWCEILTRNLRAILHK